MRSTRAIAFVVLVLFIAVAPALADTRVNVYDADKELAKSVVFPLNVKEYYVDNKLPGTKMDVAPFIENGRTYVPVRYLANALGVTDESIGWDTKSQLVTLEEPGFPTVELVIGNKTIRSNDQTRQMDVVPTIRDGRTFLPARFVAESLGYMVDWDARNKVVTCWPIGMPKPNTLNVLAHLNDKPTGNTKNMNGYSVPINTELKAEVPVASSGAEFVVNIITYKPLEQQYQDLRVVLGSKFDQATVEAVVNYVKQKTERNDNLPRREFKANGKTLNVGSGAGSYWIQVLIY